MWGSLSAVILTGGPPCIEELVTCGAGDLCVHCVPVLGYPAAIGRALPAGCNTGARGQLPLGTSNYATSLYLKVWQEVVM